MRDARHHRRKNRRDAIVGVVLVVLAFSLSFLAIVHFIHSRVSRSPEVAAAADDQLAESRQSPPMAVSNFGKIEEAIEPDDAEILRRIERLLMVNPKLTSKEAAALVEESDRIRVAIEAAGVTDADLSIRHEINDTEVSDDELRAYYESNRERFGDRTFEESRSSLETLVRLRKVRSKYGDEPDQTDSPGSRNGS